MGAGFTDSPRDEARAGGDLWLNGWGAAFDEVMAACGSPDRPDGWITTKVKSTLLYSSNVDGSDIKVDTKNGVVTLSGKVDTGAERALGP